MPQGSVLGPLLFILYIIDLEDYLNGSRIGLDADDTALYYSSNNFQELILMLQDEIGTVEQWLRANKLSLNVSKTKMVIFGSPYRTRNIPNVNLCILTFNEYIEIFVQKSKQKLGVLSEVRKCLDRSTAFCCTLIIVIVYICRLAK